jgi:hypothetical protein
MSARDIHKSDPQLLAKLMSLDTEAGNVWQSDELGAILRHQLQAPLEFDLITVDTEVKAKLKTLAATDGPPLKTFGDLLRHPRPPIELLALTKEYGKIHRNTPESPLPSDIATVLYFAGIVVALTRCGQRISQLDDDDLRRGVEWVIAQPWVDEATRSLFREGLTLIPAQKQNPS